MVSVVAAVWFPIAALLTPANVADSEPAPTLLNEVPAEVRFVLGDRHYNTPSLHEYCEQADRLLVTTKYGRYPHTDDGVEVRRVFHKLRSIAMENFNELIFGIFDGHGQVPTKGLLATQRFALGAIFVYQLALLYRFEHDLQLCVGLKAFRKRGLMIYDQASFRYCCERTSARRIICGDTSRASTGLDRVERRRAKAPLPHPTGSRGLPGLWDVPQQKAMIVAVMVPSFGRACGQSIEVCLDQRDIKAICHACSIPTS